MGRITRSWSILVHLFMYANIIHYVIPHPRYMRTDGPGQCVPPPIGELAMVVTHRQDRDYYQTQVGFPIAQNTIDGIPTRQRIAFGELLVS